MKELKKILLSAEEENTAATKDAIYAVLEMVVNRAPNTPTVEELVEYIGELMDELE